MEVNGTAVWGTVVSNPLVQSAICCKRGHTTINYVVLSKATEKKSKQIVKGVIVFDKLRVLVQSGKTPQQSTFLHSKGDETKTKCS